MIINNIVFDFGGVLLSEDDGWLTAHELKNLLEKDFSKASDAWKAGWPDTKTGKINEEEFFEIFLITATGNSDTDTIEKLKQIYRKNTFKSDAFEVLQKLKKNYSLYALTNISRDWLNYKIKEFNLNEYFELIISSSGERVGKPDKKIYEALINKTGIIPGETLFIDNFPRNMPPAKELGMNTLVFENYNQLLKDFKKFGINI